MKRRVTWLGVTLAAIALVLIGVQGSNAGLGGQTSRFKTVEIETTQYIWELVSNSDGRVICQAIVDHATRPSHDETLTICSEQIFPPEPTLTPWPTYTPTPGGAPEVTATPQAEAQPTLTPVPDSEPFDLAVFFRAVSWRFVQSRKLMRTIQVPLPEIIVNLSVPNRPTEQLFATISAYEPVLDHYITGIYGTLNGWDFACSSNRCDVPIQTDSVIEFWATSSLGDESKHVQGTLRRLLTDDGVVLKVEALSPVTVFQDSCALTWGVQTPNDLDWAVFPLTPDELNTMKPYQYLSSQLIASGVVKADECLGGGLYASGGANACGLEKAAGAVIEWQNQYDMTIWDTARQLGIPPRLIKALIEQESQFWPGNARNTMLEYGLGQLSQSGVDVVLRWDNDLFRDVCNTLLFDCSMSYGRLPSWLQATVRGGLLRNYDAECPTCPRGLNMERAYDSIPIISRTLRANCRQVQYLIDRHGVANTNYEDLWKLTFASYHSGFQCVSNALDYVSYNRQPAEWYYISGYMDCFSTNAYVDSIWNSLSEFENYRIKRAESSKPVNLVMFSPTPAPTLTPTPVLAMSHVRVVVFMDSNGNHLPEVNEKVDDVRVEVRFPDGVVRSSVTVNGEANIDLNGYTLDTIVVVALPELYRETRVGVIKDGEIPVFFRLDQPVVPPGLP